MTRAVFIDYQEMYGEDLDNQVLHDAFEQLTIYQSTPADALVERLKETEVVITSGTRLDAEVINQLPDLRLIIIAATGTDCVDLVAAKQQGVVVCNCQDYASDSLAQHTIALLLTLVNQTATWQPVMRTDAWQQKGTFCLLTHLPVTLTGKTLGIVGFGATGKRVATIAEALGMKVILTEFPGRPVREGRQLLDQVLPELDILTLHCPLTEETHHLINADRLAKMKPEARLINIARGDIVDEQALATALRAQTLAGAAIDVFAQEPPPKDHPLLDPALADRLIITPHVAWSSREARQAILQQVAENGIAFAKQAAIRVVN